MKKITLVAFSLVSTMAFAQFTGVSSGETTLSQNRGGSGIILEQFEDGANAIVSCTSTPESAIVLCAEDFNLTEETTITAITIRGTILNGLQTNITGWDLYIFNDTAGTPGEDPSNTTGAPLVLTNINGAGITVTDDGATAVDVEFDLQTLVGDVDLPAGDYWVSGGPIMNITNITDNQPATATRFSWDSSSDFNGAEPHLIDINDTFGGGFTSWTPFSALGVPVGALAFVVEGEPVLSVENNALDQIAIFPNPATDVLNVRTPSNVEITNAMLYDVLGKASNVQVVNGQISVSDLARGVYILSLETTAGTLTEKIVKQ